MDIVPVLGRCLRIGAFDSPITEVASRSGIGTPDANSLRTDETRCEEVLVSTRIDRRDDVNPEEGLHEYGDVEFADPTNHKYPIDSPEHVRAAWSYINQKDNAAKYDADDVKTIKNRIKHAAKKHGVEISED